MIPKELLKELNEIEQDCLKLKEKGFLSDFGKGELHIIEIVKEYIQTDK